eukprot:CAMPEP_0172305892 /NCGR_PEP_ID=MMETSP1058-20130122/7096_1 /TAXON_ID=83371 /ORGANISM="Detonula confervacea, Strain CCMP 353" /LENGTH=140 /DNA_ID=CAMNT_0013017623 /DNA_START=310 /DNA_END=731 /DNA_ORIENTATION=-
MTYDLSASLDDLHDKAVGDLLGIAVSMSAIILIDMLMLNSNDDHSKSVSSIIIGALVSSLSGELEVVFCLFKGLVGALLLGDLLGISVPMPAIILMDMLMLNSNDDHSKLLSVVMGALIYSLAGRDEDGWSVGFSGGLAR